MPRSLGVTLMNFCEASGQTTGNALIYPPQWQPSVPNILVPIGTDYGFKIVPRGKVLLSRFTNNAIVRLDPTTQSAPKSAGGPPTYPLYVQLDGGDIIPVDGPGWQPYKVSRIALRPYADSLFPLTKDFFWSAYFEIISANNLREISATPEIHSPVRDHIQLIHAAQPSAAPTLATQGFPVWGYYKTVRISMDADDTLERYVYQDGAWKSAGQVPGSGAAGFRVFDETIPFGGGATAVDPAFTDAPPRLYYQTGSGATHVDIFVGFDL